MGTFKGHPSSPGCQWVATCGLVAALTCGWVGEPRSAAAAAEAILHGLSQIAEAEAVAYRDGGMGGGGGSEEGDGMGGSEGGDEDDDEGSNVKYADGEEEEEEEVDEDAAFEARYAAAAAEVAAAAAADPDEGEVDEEDGDGGDEEGAAAISMHGEGRSCQAAICGRGLRPAGVMASWLAACPPPVAAALARALAIRPVPETGVTPGAGGPFGGADGLRESVAALVRACSGLELR